MEFQLLLVLDMLPQMVLVFNELFLVLLGDVERRDLLTNVHGSLLGPLRCDESLGSVEHLTDIAVAGLIDVLHSYGVLLRSEDVVGGVHVAESFVLLVLASAAKIFGKVTLISFHFKQSLNVSN